MTTRESNRILTCLTRGAAVFLLTLAACGGAPMMQVDDDYYENLTPQRVDEILDAME